MKTAKKIGSIFLFIISGVFILIGILPLLENEKEFLPLSIFLFALAVLFFFFGRRAWKKPIKTPIKEIPVKEAPASATSTDAVQSNIPSLSIEQALESSNSSSVFAKNGIKTLNKMLLPNENIKYAVWTNVAILPNLGSLDANEAFSLKTLKDRVTGIVAISDRRIV